jgi:hypothetical protein
MLSGFFEMPGSPQSSLSRGGCANAYARSGRYSQSFGSPGPESVPSDGEVEELEIELYLKHYVGNVNAEVIKDQIESKRT